MKLLLVFLLFLLILSFLFVLVIGWGHTKSRELILSAVEHFKNANFEAARQLILLATRYNGKLLKNDRLKSFYELVVTKKGDLSVFEIHQLRTIAESWPRTRPESIWQSKVSQVFFFGVIGLGILLKILAIF